MNFSQKSFRYLGYESDKGILHTLVEKVKAIANWGLLKNKNARLFLHKCCAHLIVLDVPFLKHVFQLYIQ